MGTAKRAVHTPTPSDHANVVPSGDHVSPATVPCGLAHVQSRSGTAGGGPGRWPTVISSSLDSALWVSIVAAMRSPRRVTSGWARRSALLVGPNQ